MSKRFIAAGMLSSLLLIGGGNLADAQAITVAQQTAGTCVGTIVSENGEEVIGATVKVKGTSMATSTNIDGKFSLTGVKPGAVLEISCIGYEPLSVTWNGQPLSLTMKETANALDEVVVVGYGVQKKANVTGSVSSMKASQIASRPVSSVTAAMAGEMPGVTVIQNSGAPGSQTGSVTVRGKNTINAGEPLVIVDGVPGQMNNIAPEEIESVSVLKDAASAAIYGVQAANGVILITTKKGTKGQRTQISYSGNVAWARPTARLAHVDAYNHATMLNEALANDGLAPRYNEWQIERWANGTFDATTPNTDWWGETFKKNQLENQHTVTINGGTEKTTYMISLAYLRQDGLVEQNHYDRYNGRINLASDIAKWLTFGTTNSFYRGITQDGSTGVNSIMHHVNRTAATDPVYARKQEGLEGNNVLYSYTDQWAYNLMENPVAEAQEGATGNYKQTVDNLHTTFYLDIKPIEGLSIKPLFSWRHQTNNWRSFSNTLSYSGWTSGDRVGDVRYYNYDWYTYQVVANYMKQIGKHGFTILGGYESSKYTYMYTRAYRKGGGWDDLLVLNPMSKANQDNEDTGVRLTRQSWFGRVTYDYDSRYLFEANFRADASSRFPKNSRWGYFPAVSAAWRISQESFMEDTRDWLSNLKLRLGWGRTGNEEISDYYPGVATYAMQNSNTWLGSSLVSGAYESRLVNDKLKWATVTNYEVGLEASFLNNIVGFEAAAYRKDTKDMLLNLPVLSVIGMASPAQNAGSVRNTGFEFSVFHNYRLNKDWSWNVSFNMAYNHNEITELEGTEGPSSYDKIWYLEGHPVGSYYGYICDGIFRTQEEFDKGPHRLNNEKVGNLRYKDIGHYDENGDFVPIPDGKIDGADRAVIGKNFPSWTGGVNLGVSYRDFDLSMLWQGAFDVDVYVEGEAMYAFYNGASALDWQTDHWSVENPNGNFPRLTTSANSPDYCTNSYWLKNGNYVRLKNLTFGYTIPRELTQKAHLEKVRFYFSGENLWTISPMNKYNLDPEAPNTYQNRGAFQSNVRKFSFGLNLTI